MNSTNNIKNTHIDKKITTGLTIPLLVDNIQDQNKNNIKDMNTGALPQGSATPEMMKHELPRVLQDTDNTKIDIKNIKDIIEKQNEYEKGINWDEENINTLDNWISECVKQHFIYDYVLDKIIMKSKITKIIMLIVCAIQSIISVTNLGIQDNIYMMWAFKILLSISSVTTYIITQYTTIEKIDDDIKSYTIYTENIKKFLSNLTATADIKSELRPDGNKFINDHKELYMNICQTNPNMSQGDWNDANSHYTEFLTHLDTNNYHGRNKKAYTYYISGSKNKKRNSESDTSTDSHHDQV
jgi:hypothetical protein